MINDEKTSASHGLLTRRAPVNRNTFDAAARTVELVWAAGAEVERFDWKENQRYIEILDMRDAAVDLSRLNAGAPVLDTHGSSELSNVLGVVERAWIEDGKGLAVVRFSDRPDVAGIVSDVQSGIIRNASVGYTVEQWQRSTRDGRQVRTAVRWTPQEISLVAVPADALAQVRSAIPECAPSEGEAIMAHQNEASAAPADEISQQDAVALERARIASLEAPLNDAADRGLDAAALSFLRARAIDEGWTADVLRARLFDAIPKRQAPVNVEPAHMPPVVTARIGMSYDDPQVRIDAMATALARKVNPAVQAAISGEKWQEYRGLRPSDLMLDLASARGERVSARDRSRLVERAFHTTSDFPQLLSVTANKLLDAGYRQAAPTYREVFARKNFNDFKAHSFLTAGDFPALAELAEGGEITAGTMSEKRETVTPKTHARQLRVTRQMLVNDDLGVFLDLAGMIGPRIADYENALCYAMLNTASGDGPTLSEGNAAVFTTGRGNKAATPAAVSEASVEAAFNAMMAMTSLDGIKLNIQPTILLCSPAQRFKAMRVANAVVANNSASVNPLAGLFRVVADANIPGNRWYMFADPVSRPVYVYGYVNGNDRPIVREAQPIGYDAVVMDVLLDFAVGAIDFRGGYFNAGA